MRVKDDQIILLKAYCERLRKNLEFVQDSQEKIVALEQLEDFQFFAHAAIEKQEFMHEEFKRDA